MPLSADPSIYFLNIEECYEFMYELNRCYLENPFLKYFGHCQFTNSKVSKCLMRQRELRQQKNLEESRIKYRDLRKRLIKQQSEDETS